MWEGRRGRVHITRKKKSPTEQANRRRKMAREKERKIGAVVQPEEKKKRKKGDFADHRDGSIPRCPRVLPGGKGRKKNQRRLARENLMFGQSSISS